MIHVVQTPAPVYQALTRAERQALLHSGELTPPDDGWLERMQSALASTELRGTLPAGWAGDPLAGFLELINPLITSARQQLRAGIEELIRHCPQAPFRVEAATLLEAGLCPHLLQRLNRTLALELHTARTLGLLQGETPEARFDCFLELLRQPEIARTLLEEYPVLTRQLLRCLDLWVEAGLEFLSRLAADWPEIVAGLAGSEPGPLVALEGGAGDMHRSGRAVLIARFESGFTLVYKPRPLAVDRHFQEFLGWVNSRERTVPFRTLRILDRGPYGWAEYVSAADCTAPEEVSRFYQRLGGYLALLFVLEATDFHSENLIACGEHPMLVDLEALFHPRISNPALEPPTGLDLERSVMSVALLPHRIWGKDDAAGVDISGMGSADGQLSPFRVPDWEGVGTDQLRLVRRQVEMSGDHNRPRLNGGAVPLLEFASPFIAGFTAVYRLLLEQRDELRSDQGPLARFAGDEVRVIVRGTKTYGVLLDESFHPDVLRDAAERDRLFDRLWGRAAQIPALAALIPHEQADLWNGDIPLFTARPGSRHLWTSRGELLPDLLPEPGLDLVRRQLNSLGEADLRRQLWIIRASLATVEHPDSYERITVSSDVSQTASAGEQRPGRSRWLAAAGSIGDWLADHAIHARGRATWLGLVTGERRQHWDIAPLGVNLYDGLAGIILLLARLGQATGEARHDRLARAALGALRVRLADAGRPPAGIGAFDGLGGIVYLFTHLAAIWQEDSLLEDARQLAGTLHPLISGDEQGDIIGGAAGYIHCLLPLYRRTGWEPALQSAVACGEHLLRTARKLERGVGWATDSRDIPLTGLSHGAAGMAWSLLELAGVTGRGDFRRIAEDALDYERSLYSASEANWRDLRVFAELPADEQPGFGVSWCHGAPGIGLARLATLRHLDDSETRDEIQTAVETTLRHGFGGNHSLCHGDLGNLELPRLAARLLPRHDWTARTNALAEGILTRIETGGGRCALPLAVESPGLMTGLSGIAYALLQLADPDAVPSLLLLEGPTD